jgi:uncharacterized YigZ family protein
LEVIDAYKTMDSLSEGIYKEKGSKFIGYAVACYSEDEAKIHLTEWKKMHHQARHVCYAYRFGLDKKVFRANDDGEPSNSAGIPILGQIQSFDLSNVLIGVVRYFGGTKLGVGGLIQAYKAAAKDAIEEGKIVEKQVFEHFEIKFNYNEMPEIMSLVKNHHLTIEKQDFAENCLLEIAVPFGKSNYIRETIEENKHIELNYLGNY